MYMKHTDHFKTPSPSPYLTSFSTNLFFKITSVCLVCDLLSLVRAVQVTVGLELSTVAW